MSLKGDTRAEVPPDTSDPFAIPQSTPGIPSLPVYYSVHANSNDRTAAQLQADIRTQLDHSSRFAHHPQLIMDDSTRMGVRADTQPVHRVRRVFTQTAAKRTSSRPSSPMTTIHPAFLTLPSTEESRARKFRWKLEESISEHPDQSFEFVIQAFELFIQGNECMKSFYPDHHFLESSYKQWPSLYTEMWLTYMRFGKTIQDHVDFAGRIGNHPRHEHLRTVQRFVMGRWEYFRALAEERRR